MFKNLKRQIQDEKGSSGAKIFPQSPDENSLQQSSIHSSESAPNFSFSNSQQNSSNERLVKRSFRESSDSNSWQSDGTVSPLSPTSELSFSSYIPAEQLHQPTAVRSNLERVYEDYRAKTNDLLGKKDAHINRLQERLATLEGRVELLQRNDQLSELKAENSRLEKTHRDYQKAFEAEKSQLTQSYETKTAELMAKLQADVEFYRRQVENCNCQALAAENDNLKVKLAEIQRRNDILSEDKRQLSLAKLTASVQQSPDLSNEKLSLLERRAVELQNRLIKAREEIEELEADKLALINRLASTEEELNRSKQLTDDLQRAKAHEFVTNLDIKTEQHITDLANEVEDLQLELEKNHRDLTVMYQQLSEKSEECGRMKVKNENLESTVARQRDVIENLRDDCDRLNDEKKEESKDKDGLILHSASLNREIEGMKKQREKIAAELSELSRQLEKHTGMVRDLEAKKAALTNEVSVKQGGIGEPSGRMLEMEKLIGDQEETIRQQNQKLRAVQREVRQLSQAINEREVNDQYLKNVVLKFISSEPDEAGQLIKAVSTLLRLTVDEENCLRELLRWKLSWMPMGSKPRLGSVKSLSSSRVANGHNS